MRHLRQHDWVLVRLLGLFMRHRLIAARTINDPSFLEGAGSDRRRLRRKPRCRLLLPPYLV
jgi:hypothetical protein